MNPETPVSAHVQLLTQDTSSICSLSTSVALQLHPSTLDYLARRNERKIAELQSLLEESQKELRRLQNLDTKGRISKKPKLSRSKDSVHKQRRSVGSSRRAWNSQEQKLFDEAWKIHGPTKSWREISDFIGARVEKQVRAYAERKHPSHPPAVSASHAEPSSQGSDTVQENSSISTPKITDPNYPVISETTDPASPALSDTSLNTSLCAPDDESANELPLTQSDGPLFQSGGQGSTCCYTGLGKDISELLGRVLQCDWDGSYWEPASPDPESTTIGLAPDKEQAWESSDMTDDLLQG